MLVEHASKSDSKYKLSESGTGDLDEVIDELNDGKVQFFFIGMDLSGVRKFVFIAFCGANVSGMKKGYFANHSKDFEKFFHGFHVQINAI
jgi:hypothetical protein